MKEYWFAVPDCAGAPVIRCFYHKNEVEAELMRVAKELYAKGYVEGGADFSEGSPPDEACGKLQAEEYIKHNKRALKLEL